MKEIRQLEATEYVEYVDGGKHALKNAAISPFHEGFDSAGKKLKDDEVVVDVDGVDKKIIQQIITIFGIKTEVRWTDRGAHFYYTKPKGYKHKPSGVCPLGFKVEWKIAEKTPSVTVKRNGILREPENEHVREELPEFFIYKAGLKSLLGMEDEEGRNSGLFAYRMKINSLENWKQILTFINRHVFAQPLDEKELAGILRDGVNFDTKKDSVYEVAMTLVKKLKVVKFGELLYSYDGACYHNGVYFKYDVAQELAGKSVRYIDHVFKQMDLHLLPIQEPSEGWKIKFKNGFLSNGQWSDMDYTDFTPYYIDLAYDENAPAVKEVDDYLAHISMGDESYRLRILETMAHTLITDPHFKGALCKIFIVIGGGGNGKGLFVKIIKHILGPKNCSAVSIKQMGDEKYFNSLIGKLVNLADDLNDEYITKNEAKILKNASSSDYISARKLYDDSKDVVTTASLIFTSNHLLKSQEKGDSWKRRIDWMPIDKKPTKPDTEFFRKVTTDAALRYWMKLIVEAYQRLYANKKFTDCKIINDFNENYHIFNDNITQFLDEFSSPDYWIGCGKNELYNRYVEWCAATHEKGVQGKEKLFEQVMKRFNLDYGKMNVGSGKQRTSTTGFFLKKSM